jgi:hypothetical protein
MKSCGYFRKFERHRKKFKLALSNVESCFLDIIHSYTHLIVTLREIDLEESRVANTVQIFPNPRRG